MGVPSYLIADSDELQRDWIEGAFEIGVTAGASAPEELVLGVIDWLGQFGPVEISTVGERDEVIEFRLPSELRA
jgi:4-hydroxy-3-methylbut-2-enyl diphosphate reductase